MALYHHSACLNRGRFHMGLRRVAVQLFQGTSVLIAQYGTAAHNVLFLRPGSVLVLLLQPGWCPWRWAFADQALLLGVHVITLCPDDQSALARHRLPGEDRLR
jgi:capsular polysaccharide biosynthesis protein